MNNKKNVVFLVAVSSNHDYLKEKHGDFKYFEFSINSWKYWCDKNNAELFIYDTPSNDEHVKHKPTWQRWFDVFDQLESNDINYNKILVVDASTIIRWDTPNFFDLVDDNLNVFRSLENIRWMYQGVSGYKSFFNNFEFKLNKYIDCGFQIFTKKHKSFLTELKDFYFDNYDSIMELQNDKVKRGTDQPVYNYLLQIKNIDVKTELPNQYMLTHLTRFDWFSHNWQLNEDTTPFFIKYGYIWKYSGFPKRGDRYELMKQTWAMVKDNYK